ncbi:glycosyl hydrolase family 65 protein [Alkalimonas sp. MEB108]|uniref:Glycosyl hydrolase family 65 protein n=1 Tax=Alkalimonas cellulosilytica TaxID=3058395 RepID=A0ABU7J7Y1_9GAMM|nr:glycosyl hydrolase family 65 protein [Alkalimonas sp. MEB108]MEE2002000.1 glycosyl hydrolase family 65 protein [Alkalimonas sp. MEB108]
MASRTPFPGPLQVDPWRLTEQALIPAQPLLCETLLSLANGYIGTRGTLEEGLAGQSSCEGTYLNGVYSSEPIQYGESACGFARNNHTMLQVANGKRIYCELDGERIELGGALEHQRSLDMRQGLLQRQWQWQSKNGKRLLISSQRLVSMQHPELMCITYQLTALNFTGEVQVFSELDACYAPFSKKDDPRVGVFSIADTLNLQQQGFAGQQGWMLHRVHGSDFAVCAMMQHEWPAVAGGIRQLQQQPGVLCEQASWSLQQGEAASLTKWVLYRHQTSQHSSDLTAWCHQQLATLSKHSFADLAAAQAQACQQFWQQADVQIEGDAAMQQGIRFNLFSLWQSAGKDGHSNIGAKGLTGPGYDGHYFWDTEIYVIPCLSFTQPVVARQLLGFRYRQLDAARLRAREMAHSKGALYPWRTIGGEECSAYFPAGTAQYHINAAIAYAIRCYYLATADWDFMREQGIEMLVETARLWLELGFFNPRRDGAFEIHAVTGPDEYTAIVNNNFYTNAMAQLHLRFAIEMVAKLEAEAPERLKDWQLSAAELALWQQAAEQMYLPLDERLGVHPQDDSFLQKQRWDFAATPKDKYPLLLHYHPLVIYRHQVLKQADVVLAMVLLDDAISPAQKARNLAYYEPLTTHDSSLSACIHSIACAELGQLEQALTFFGDSARMDLDNQHGNTEHGVHIACMAGTWQALVFGFAGLRSRPDGLHFAPRLPAQLPGLSFRLNYRGRILEFSVQQGKAQYQLQQGEPLTIYHDGEALQLIPQQPQQRPLLAGEVL